ncbi:catechol 1,2-dioxygenase, partial [Pseudomonas fragi]|nr:catechol 1,2-dioxygenase [Pseudomonas sp. GC01]
MTVKISQTPELQAFFKEVSGGGNDQGSPRAKQLLLRLVNEVARIVEDLEVTDDEFWAAVDYLNRLGARSEAGLLVAGLGV